MVLVFVDAVLLVCVVVVGCVRLCLCCCFFGVVFLLSLISV